MANDHNPEDGPIEDESSVETIALDMSEPLAQAIQHMDAIIRMCQGSGELLFNLEHVQNLMEQHYIDYLPEAAHLPQADHEDSTLNEREIATENAFLILEEIPHGDPWQSWTPEENDEFKAEAEAERQADAQAELEAEACYGDDLDGGWY